MSQMVAVARHVLWNSTRGVRRYALVLMLEPLFRCNLACEGCGKIEHPADVLRKHLTPSQCFDASEQCAAPIVSIPGGEPLLHPQIDHIVAGLTGARGLCISAPMRCSWKPRCQSSAPPNAWFFPCIWMVLEKYMTEWWDAVASMTRRSARSEQRWPKVFESPRTRPFFKVLIRGRFEPISMI